MGASLKGATTVITTVRHNVGDDFVREGILALLEAHDGPPEVEVIHKHSPVTAVHGFERVRSYWASLALEPAARALGLRNRIDQAGLLVQSGAPVYWCHEGGPHCADNEWFGPLIRRRFLPARNGRRFISLAGGSCQSYHWDPVTEPVCPNCLAYIREFFDACDLTVVRDDVARTMLQVTGRDARVLPCTSIFARDRLGMAPQPAEYIVLNFMENGGHYTFGRIGQSIDAALWRRQFVKMARLVATMGRVVVACHTPAEDALARELVPELQRFLVPDDHVAFMQFYARAKWGVLNRVHGAFMLASFGRPAVVIGSDSRARMIENMGLPSYHVGDLATHGVEAIVETARARSATYADEAEAIRVRARTAYLDELRVVLSS